VCGIAISLDLDGRRRGGPWALPLMRHRGPDGEAVVANGDGVVLEHCRLAIIDPDNPRAAQPFSDRTGRRVLVYNGEIFNYRELRADLERRGAVFRTESDTEVLLEGFALDGERILDRLRGMFAFVLWDRETGELFAARDQLGVKPLYYVLADGIFIAASELRTVLGHPSVKRTLDPAAVVEYLAFGYTTGERTLVDGVRKLQPGHSLRLLGRSLDVREYWDALGGGMPAQHVEDALQERLEGAVAASLVSDVPVGLMLSGGLDSSAVAALAARHGDPGALTAYSVSFGLPDDESTAAARLASDLGFRHRTIRLDERALADGFGEWLGGLDVPSSNPTWAAVSHIARAAREDGIKVLLSGDGADELFGGYNRWMTYLRFHDRVWGRTPHKLRRVGGWATRPLLGGLAGDMARRARDGGELFVGSRPLHDDDLDRCLGPVGRVFAAEFPPEDPLRALRATLEERRPDADYLTWMSYSSLKRDLVEDYLGRLDTMGMRESVEGRVPLLDADLARFALALPQAVKVRGYEQKALFRRTVSRFLPDYVTRRPKQGFCPPVAAWAQSLLDKHVTRDSVLVEQGLVAPDASARLREKKSVNGSFALWTLGTLTAWAEANV
jgi:asparagine synthase (glutamine-hydrolysing)